MCNTSFETALVFMVFCYRDAVSEWTYSLNSPCSTHNYTVITHFLSVEYTCAVSNGMPPCLIVGIHRLQVIHCTVITVENSLFKSDHRQTEVVC